MTNAPVAQGSQASLNGYLALGLGLVILLFFGLGGWAANASISGAVISSGKLIVKSNATEIQHLDGGIVFSVDVADGDRVNAGDQLMALDSTILDSSLAELVSQYGELRTQVARLTSEVEFQQTFSLPADLQLAANRDGPLAELISGQHEIQEARFASLHGRQLQLREQIEQFGRQTEGIALQREAMAEEMALIDEQIETQSALFDKGLIKRSTLVELMRERITAKGSLGELGAQIAQIEQTVSEREIQIIQLKDSFRERAQQELQTARLQVTVLAERIAQVQDQLQRLTVRAPVSGIVHEVAVKNVGGVVAPGQVLLKIIPQQDQLVIESEIAAMDIDQVYAGQQARVRLVSLDMREAPELLANIIHISPDTTLDRATNAHHYVAKLEFEQGEITKLDQNKLVPGMPVEAYIQTGDRTVMTYLLQPLSDQFARAFKE